MACFRGSTPRKTVFLGEFRGTRRSAEATLWAHTENSTQTKKNALKISAFLMLSLNFCGIVPRGTPLSLIEQSGGLSKFFYRALTRPNFEKNSCCFSLFTLHSSLPACFSQLNFYRHEPEVICGDAFYGERKEVGLLYVAGGAVEVAEIADGNVVFFKNIGESVAAAVS